MTSLEQIREQRAAEAERRAREAERTVATSEDYYYNNNSAHGAGHAPREPWQPEDGERICQAYLDNVADSMTRSVACIIENAYNAGLTVDEIIMAIEETGLAPHPSPRYLQAILKNWIECGYTVCRARFYSETNNSRVAWWKPEGRKA